MTNLIVDESLLRGMAPSKATGIKVMWAVYQILLANGEAMRSRDIFSKIADQVPMSAAESEIHESNGLTRWATILHWYSVDAVKAGFLTKKAGTWTLTEEGRQNVALGPVAAFLRGQKGYKQWAASQTPGQVQQVAPVTEEAIESNVLDITQPQTRQAIFDSTQGQARSDIEDFIRAKNPYEFQELVAALLRGMGYHTPFVAARGPDGGIDIIALRDPLGVTTPRIKVQVKHRPDHAIPPSDVRSLKGVLDSDTEFGLFVTSGRFTSDATSFARQSGVNMRLINLDEFIELWIQFYQKLTDEDKLHLPLQPIMFLATVD